MLLFWPDVQRQCGCASMEWLRNCLVGGKIFIFFPSLCNYTSELQGFDWLVGADVLASLGALKLRGIFSHSPFASWSAEMITDTELLAKTTTFTSSQQSQNQTPFEIPGFGLKEGAGDVSINTTSSSLLSSGMNKFRWQISWTLKSLSGHFVNMNVYIKIKIPFVHIFLQGDYWIYVDYDVARQPFVCVVAF